MAKIGEQSELGQGLKSTTAMWAHQNSKAQCRKRLPTWHSGVLLATNTQSFPVNRTHKNWHKEIRVFHKHPTPDFVSIRFRWKILTLVNCINRQKKICPLDSFNQSNKGETNSIQNSRCTQKLQISNLHSTDSTQIYVHRLQIL